MVVFTGAIADHRGMDDEWITERKPDEPRALKEILRLLPKMPKSSVALSS